VARDSHVFASTVREVLELKLLRRASPLPLTVSQFHLLKLLSYDGSHPLGQVAGFLGVTPPAATKCIDKLEALGFVARTPSAGDRRATLLTVSRKGRRLVRRYEGLKVARLRAVVERFRPEEVDQLTRLLERFAVSLLELEPDDDGSCLRCAAYLEAGCPVARVRGGCPYQALRGERRALPVPSGAWRGA
jgi:DNA-binding MarR family transcriptional regulator